MRPTIFLVLVSVVFTAAYGFGGSEEKFIKKYAMMKVYESCFGLQVLKEVRKEMKEAAQKCAGFQHDFDDKYINHEPTEGIKEHYTVAMTTERPTRPPRPSHTTRKPIHTADTLLLQQWSEDQNKLDHVHEEDQPESDTESDNETENDTAQPPTRKPLDLSKLEEAILNINRPMNHLGLPHQRPAFPPAGASPNYQAPPSGYYPPMFYPPPMPYPAPAYPYSPYYPGYYQPQAAPGAAAPYTPYYSRSGYRSAKITKGFNAGKVGEADSVVAQVSNSGRQKKLMEDLTTATSHHENTTASTNSHHQILTAETAAPAPSRQRKMPADRSAKSSGRRHTVSVSTASPNNKGRTLVPPKDLDVKASIDAMTFHSGAKMRNITCVMQELGYLDENLEPNYEKMMDRITKLQVSTELKRDMVDGVKFCKQFSQCVPEVRKDKFQLSKELLRPMFFFRCYKHKKLESCIMKDVRDRFASSTSSAFEDNSSMANELRRSFQKTDLASSVFEFMYGSSADDFEALL